MRKLAIFAVLLVFFSQSAWANEGCPDGWTSVGGWYREDDTCKLRCAQPGQPNWWMDSGGESRPGCGDLREPAPTYFDIWGDTQAPLSDCPPGFEPEHVWFEQNGTCLLDCVNKTYVDRVGGVGYDRRKLLDLPRHKCQVYVDSEGESRPPWCILEN